MSDNIVISVKNVSKAYRIWRDPSARLKAPLIEAWQKLRFKSYELLAKTLNLKTDSYDKSANSSRLISNSFSPYYKDFYALKDVSFEVKKGESVGIIGRNGSGKSTLLQMIAGTLTPTTGSIQVNGRVAALLELGSGFNQQFTGRENVFMNAAILGLASNETEKLFNEIEQFADIGDFIDQPVKTYSSGMLMRLAFAVQAMVKPDILIIDEALSVGDYFFTQKCFSLINKLKASGTTLLFVSHDMGTIRDLCPRVFLFNQGNLEFDGQNSWAINKYFQDIQMPDQKKAHKINEGEIGAIVSQQEMLGWRASKEADLEKTACLVLVKIEDQDGNFLTTTKIGGEITFKIYYKAIKTGRYRVCVEIKNKLNQIVTSNSCFTAGLPAKYLEKEECCCFEMHLTSLLEAGRYTYKIYLAEDSHVANRNPIIEETPWLEPFSITWDYENIPAPFLGMFGPPVSISYK